MINALEKAAVAVSRGAKGREFYKGFFMNRPGSK
jgi:hypothetical protein